jgi:hypothetical protein
MDFAEVIEELPQLTRQQRRDLSLRLMEFDCSPEESEDLAVCEFSAALGFALLDEMEAKNPGQ